MSTNSSGIAPTVTEESTLPSVASTVCSDFVGVTVFVSGTICTLPVPAWYPLGMVYDGSSAVRVLFAAPLFGMVPVETLPVLSTNTFPVSTSATVVVTADTSW